MFIILPLYTEIERGEDQLVAFYVLMHSRDPQSKELKNDSTKKLTTDDCSTCSILMIKIFNSSTCTKFFPSYQALKGRKASQTKANGSSEVES